MNAHTPITAAPSDYRARYAARVAAMAKAAIEWADRPHDPYFRLRFLDIAQFVIDADLSDDIDECRRDLWIDDEGYPLDDAGFTALGRDRVYIPPVVECGL